MESHRNSFLRLFCETARYENRYRVFSDFLDCATAAVHNRFVFDEDLENLFRICQRRYKDEDMRRFSELLAELRMGLQSGFSDFLGDVFMQLELGNQARGQVFTPYHLSQLTCRFGIGDVYALLERQPFVLITDSAAGAASMPIAFAEALHDAGYDHSERMWAQCTDIDDRCAKMSYLQLALLGVPAEVVVGDSLRMTVRKALRTPMHYLGEWDRKLSDRHVTALESPSAPKVLGTGQLALFDFEVVL